jgi:hypothetical protein
MLPGRSAVNQTICSSKGQSKAPPVPNKPQRGLHNQYQALGAKRAFRSLRDYAVQLRRWRHFWQLSLWIVQQAEQITQEKNCGHCICNTMMESEY